MPERLSDAQLETVAQGPPGRRWVLLEAPLRGLENDYTVAADGLRERGFAVVVAHPERAFRRSGGRPARRRARARRRQRAPDQRLVGRRAVRRAVRANALWRSWTAPRAVVASDAHGGARMPALGLAVEALSGAGVATRSE